MVNSPGDKQQSHPGDDELGPVDFFAIEFPNSRITAPGFERLLSLTDQGVVGILDLEFIAKDSAGQRPQDRRQRAAQSRCGRPGRLGGRVVGHAR